MSRVEMSGETVSESSKELAAELEQVTIEFTRRKAAEYGGRNAIALALTGITAFVASAAAKMSTDQNGKPIPEKEDIFFSTLVQNCKVFMPMARELLGRAIQQHNVVPLTFSGRPDGMVN